MSRSDPPTLDRQQLARGLDPLFGNLPEDVLAEIAALLETRQLRTGECLVAQGDPSDGIHIVLSGRLCASVVDGDGNEREVAEVAAGESVGETSLLTRQPHSVTYRALRDSVLVRLSQAAFVELSHTHPGLLWNVARQVTYRLKYARNGSVRRAEVRTVALVFLDEEVDRRDFGTRFCGALRRHGSAICVDPTSAEAMGSGGAEEPGSSGWLDRLESSHRFVLMQLDGAARAWSHHCARQADRILLIAAAGGDPAVTALERDLLDRMPDGAGAASELVLVHENGDVEPSGTAAWLADRDLLRHHHLRCDRETDFARLARFLAGEAVGLVFAGGGAKAFVHLGVVKALHEAGVPIDMVGGSSMGAILAGGVAKGWDPEQLVENVRQAFTRRNPLTDYTFPPLISMMRGRRMENLLRRYFGEGDIEDLWLPYLCVTGNFSLGEMAVHRSGALWRAVKGSVSLPGILPPTVINGHLHVDGGTFDNFPVEPMRAAGAGRIVACDIRVPLRPRISYEDTPSGWRFFVNRYLLRRRSLKVPHIMTTLFRSSFLASNERRKAAARRSDLIFSSPSGRVGLTQWKKLDDAMAAGYAHARRRLEEAGPEVLRKLGVAASPEPTEGNKRATAVG